MAPRQPSEEERALWRAATRDVRRRAGAAPARRTEAGPSLPPARPAAATVAVAAAPPPRPAAGLDRRSALRLKRGQMAIEARLDLHGLTQAEAHAALLRFIARAQEEGRRAVLVITGKGGGDGVLRRAVPLWLAAPACAGRVLASAPAQARDGGDGALYVLLRRRRAVT